MKPLAAPMDTPLRSHYLQDFVIGVTCELGMVCTLGMPLDVLKTKQAANRTWSLGRTVCEVWGHGGLRGFYVGLPWAIIETYAGGVLVLSQWAAQAWLKPHVRSETVVACTSGVMAGLAQAVAMCPTTRLKTAHIGLAGPAPSAASLLSLVVQRGGVGDLFRGLVPLSLRQATSWGCRYGFTRMYQGMWQEWTGRTNLSQVEGLACAMAGGLSTLVNHPMEVIMVEMQRLPPNLSPTPCPVGCSEPKLHPDARCGAHFTSPRGSGGWRHAAARIYGGGGLKGFFRGVGVRGLLNCYVTVCMVWGSSQLRACLQVASLRPRS